MNPRHSLTRKRESAMDPAGFGPMFRADPEEWLPFFIFFPSPTGAPYPSSPLVRGALSTSPWDLVCHTLSAEIWCLGSTLSRFKQCGNGMSAMFSIPRRSRSSRQIRIGEEATEGRLAASNKSYLRTAPSLSGETSQTRRVNNLWHEQSHQMSRDTMTRESRFLDGANLNVLGCFNMPQVYSFSRGRGRRLNGSELTKMMGPIKTPSLRPLDLVHGRMALLSYRQYGHVRSSTQLPGKSR